jgi:hypothetical protein
VSGQRTLAPPDDPRLTVSARFARLYASLAVVTVVVSSLDLYEDIVVRDDSSTFTRRFGSVWWLAWEDGGGVAGIGIVLLLALVALLLKAGLYPSRSVGYPIGIAALGAVCGLVVLARVGIRPPLPDLAAGGQATAATTLMLVVVGVWHSLALAGAARRGRPVSGAS